MKKKITLLLLAVTCALCCAFGLAACGGGTTPTVEVTSVALNKNVLTLTVGGEETLEATVLTDNATNKKVTWSSTNPEVATVDENGKVVAVAQGSAKITAAVGNKSADCTVTVKDAFIERTFNFQSIVLIDSEGNTLTDKENEDYGEFIYMAESMNTENQEKTVICKTNGEVRGTVDFGNGPFNELTGDDVYKYSINNTVLTILTQDDEVVGDGNLSGNTLTLKMLTGTPYNFKITFIGQ